MTLKYGNYIVTGTPKEIKEFIDLMEGGGHSNNLQLAINDFSINENNIPHGKVDIYDPKTGTYQQGNIRDIGGFKYEKD